MLKMIFKNSLDFLNPNYTNKLVFSGIFLFHFSGTLRHVFICRASLGTPLCSHAVCNYAAVEEDIGTSRWGPLPLC